MMSGELAGVIICKAEHEKTRPTDENATYQVRLEVVVGVVV
jgi:hypothetical protein